MERFFARAVTGGTGVNGLNGVKSLNNILRDATQVQTSAHHV